jgi:hypothetical protein
MSQVNPALIVGKAINDAIASRRRKLQYVPARNEEDSGDKLIARATADSDDKLFEELHYYEQTTAEPQASADNGESVTREPTDSRVVERHGCDDEDNCGVVCCRTTGIVLCDRLFPTAQKSHKAQRHQSDVSTAAGHLRARPLVTVKRHSSESRCTALNSNSSNRSEEQQILQRLEVFCADKSSSKLDNSQKPKYGEGYVRSDETSLFSELTKKDATAGVDNADVCGDCQHLMHSGPRQTETQSGSQLLRKAAKNTGESESCSDMESSNQRSAIAKLQKRVNAESEATEEREQLGHEQWNRYGWFQRQSESRRKSTNSPCNVHVSVQRHAPDCLLTQHEHDTKRSVCLQRQLSDAACYNVSSSNSKTTAGIPKFSFNFEAPFDNESMQYASHKSDMASNSLLGKYDWYRNYSRQVIKNAQKLRCYSSDSYESECIEADKYSEQCSFPTRKYSQDITRGGYCSSPTSSITTFSIVTRITDVRESDGISVDQHCSTRVAMPRSAREGQNDTVVKCVTNTGYSLTKSSNKDVGKPEVDMWPDDNKKTVTDCPSDDGEKHVADQTVESGNSATRFKNDPFSCDNVAQLVDLNLRQKSEILESRANRCETLEKKHT